jgi:hypothetical protein
VKYFVTSIVLMFSVAVVGGFVWSSQADSTPSNNSHTYQSDHFTIQVPTALNKTFDIVEDGESALAYQNADGSEIFTVLSAPFSDSLTTQSILQEYPFNVIDDFGLLAVGGEPAFTFVNDNNDLDGTFEVWFVHDGVLYEILTNAHLDTWLKDILTTWRFR